MKATQVGINLDLFDPFGRKREGVKTRPKSTSYLHAAIRRVEKRIPNSSFWKRGQWR